MSKSQIHINYKIYKSCGLYGVSTGISADLQTVSVKHRPNISWVSVDISVNISAECGSSIGQVLVAVLTNHQSTISRQSAAIVTEVCQ